MANTAFPLISIIVPIYNVGTYLEKCLSSIQNQTYANLEVILVDDGSTDASVDICNRFANEDSRFICIHQTNHGLSTARNVGIDHAHGEYLGFVDGDDYISPSMYSELYTDMQNKQSDIAICKYERINWNETEGSVEESYADRFTEHNALEYLCIHRSQYFTVVWNKLFKASLFKNIRFADRKGSEDVRIIADLYIASRTISFNEKKLYFYVFRPDSIINTATRRAPSYDWFEAYAERYFSLRKHGYDDMARITKLTFLQHYARLIANNPRMWHISKQDPALYRLAYRLFTDSPSENSYMERLVFHVPLVYSLGRTVRKILSYAQRYIAHLLSSQR